MRWIVLLGLAGSLSCASLDITGEDLVEAARRACAVVEVLAADPELQDSDELKNAQRACHIAKALAGVP